MGGSGTHHQMTFNRGLIADPAEFAREAEAASWLYLCGEEFASMDGGMSYADVQEAVPVARNIVADPPVHLSMELAREELAALAELPRPVLVTCRSGHRSSALVYLFAGLKHGSSAAEVLAQGRADNAPWVDNEILMGWVALGLAELAQA